MYNVRQGRRRFFEVMIFLNFGVSLNISAVIYTLFTRIIIDVVQISNYRKAIISVVLAAVADF